MCARNTFKIYTLQVRSRQLHNKRVRSDYYITRIFVRVYFHPQCHARVGEIFRGI